MPFSKECKDSDLKSLAELDDVSIEFVKWTRDYVENHSKSNDPVTSPTAKARSHPAVYENIS